MIFKFDGVTYYNGEVYQGEKYATIIFMLSWFETYDGCD